MKQSAFAHPDRIILVVTALSEERRAIIPFLKNVGAKIDGHNREFICGDYYSSEASRPWHVVLPSPTSAGNAKSAAETALSISVAPAFIFLLGVAGGFPGKVNMYDVVVADRVYFVEPAKVDAEGTYIPRPDQHKATSILLSRAKTLQDLEGWQSLLYPEISNEQIEVWIEPIAASEKLVASSSSEEFARIRANAPRAVAVENEGFGVMQAAHEANVSALVIRGISDLLDNRPPEVSVENDGRVAPDRHKLKAARHAAAFMFALLGRLSIDDLAQSQEAEDDFVIVRMKWNDLKDLTKGKSIALELLNGVPYRDVFVRGGSVEVEFKTLKIISAFIYACSIERKMFTTMIEEAPDSVNTVIDTSDPDVAKVFAAVRKLVATEERIRLVGEADILDISERHPGLKPLSHLAIESSRRLVSPNQDRAKSGDELELDKVRRLSFRVPEWQKDRLRTISAQNGISIGNVARALIEAAMVESRRRNIHIHAFIQNSDRPKSQISILIPEKIFVRFEELQVMTAVAKRSTLAGALLGAAIELRIPTNIFSRLTEDTVGTSSPPRSRGVYKIKDFDRLMKRSGMNYLELSGSAQVSLNTLRNVQNGRGLREVTAIRIIRAILEATGSKEPIGDYLIPYDG